MGSVAAPLGKDAGQLVIAPVLEEYLASLAEDGVGDGNGQQLWVVGKHDGKIGDQNHVQQDLDPFLQQL